MALLDTAEDIRKARLLGNPVADPAKVEKIIKAALAAIEKEAERVDARRVDIFMSVANVARILVERTENPEWPLNVRHEWHALFMRTLTRNLARNLAKRLPPF
jgi:hypothetical protein